MANTKKNEKPVDTGSAKDRNFEREVEEELRNDQLKQLWDKYGIYVVGAVAAVLVGLAGYQQFRHSQQVASQAAGAKFEAARQFVTGNKPAEAATALAGIAKTGPKGYATLARLQQAANDAAADKTNEAVTAYEVVAADSSGDPIIRDLARMQAAALRLDAADWTEMQNRLTPLVDERNAFRANARELLGLAARKANRTDDARKLFIQVLGDAKASKSLKDRVTGYMQGIAVADFTKATAPAAAPVTPPAAAVASEPVKK
ncbi:MAG: tetratricopeptide repeat protein [Hyphomicrobiaceae bacterium]